MNIIIILCFPVLPRRFHIPLLSSECNEIICKRDEVAGKWLLPSTVALYCSNRTRNCYDTTLQCRGSGDMPGRQKPKQQQQQIKTKRHITKKIDLD